jgi:hypothetical protein
VLRVDPTQALRERRPDGLGEVALGDEVALSVDRDRQLGEGPLRRSEDDLRVLTDVERRLVARAEQVVRLLLVQRQGQPTCVQIFE